MKLTIHNIVNEMEKMYWNTLMSVSMNLKAIETPI